MPFVPVENTALVETRMLYDNQKVENTLWVFNEEPWGPSSLHELATEVLGWWNTSYSGIVSVGVSLREVVCTDQTTETSGQVILSAGTANGILTGVQLPSNVSFSVSFHTTSRGRAFRGRNYLVGFTDGQLDTTNTVTDDYVEAVIAAYNDFNDTIGTAGWQWVIASRFSGVDPDTHKPIPRTAGVTTPVSNAAVADKTLDSQRRRLPGRGQ